MTSFPITVTQRFFATRTITVNVEADHLRQAVHRQSLDCAPDFYDPKWETSWDLHDEDTAPASPTPGWEEIEYDCDDEEENVEEWIRERDRQEDLLRAKNDGAPSPTIAATSLVPRSSDS
jgi:hypothetical protein